MSMGARSVVSLLLYKRLPFAIVFLFFLLILRRSTKATFKENINKGKSSAPHRATSKTAPVYVFSTMPSRLREHLEKFSISKKLRLQAAEGERGREVVYDEHQRMLNEARKRHRAF